MLCYLEIPEGKLGSRFPGFSVTNSDRFLLKHPVNGKIFVSESKFFSRKRCVIAFLSV